MSSSLNHIADGRPRCRAQRGSGARCPFAARRKDGPNGFYFTCGMHKRLEYVFCSQTGLPSGSARRIDPPAASDGPKSFLRIKFLPCIDEEGKDLGDRLFEFIRSRAPAALMESLLYFDTTAYCVCPSQSEAQQLRDLMPEQVLDKFVAYDIVEELPPPRSPPADGQRRVNYWRGRLPPSQPQPIQGSSIQRGGTQVNILIL